LPSTVLIVEDNLEFQWLLVSSLKMTGQQWTVTICNNFCEASYQIESYKGSFDLALVDIGLPDGNGIDVISQLNQSNSDMPILVFSVMRSEQVLVDAIRAGAKGYILKEDDNISIAKSIEQVLKYEYPISPSLARYLFRIAQTQDKRPDSFQLTKQETMVLQNLADGLTYQESADRMGISISTIRSHIQKLYRKLNTNSGSEAVAKGKAAGII